jgi:hypothetical protein
MQEGDSKSNSLVQQINTSSSSLLFAQPKPQYDITETPNPF